MIPDAPELQKKLTLSWYALIAIIVCSVIVTGTAVKVLDNDTQREQQKQYFDKQLEDLDTKLTDMIITGFETIDKKLNTNKTTHDKQLEDLKNFLVDEVKGLRSDWERRYYDDVNRRLNALEKRR